MSNIRKINTYVDTPSGIVQETVHPVTETKAVIDMDIALDSYTESFIHPYINDKLSLSRIVGLPVGHIFLWISNVVPSGCIKLNGALLNRKVYRELWEFVEESGNIITDDEWEIESLEGSVGHFSSGDGSTTFRLPLIIDFIRGKSPVEDMGRFQGDAIRNITGRIAALSATIVHYPTPGSTGPFYGLNNESVIQAVSTTGQVSVRHYLNMDTSLVVPTADENRSKNVAYQWYIKAVGNQEKVDELILSRNQTVNSIDSYNREDFNSKDDIDPKGLYLINEGVGKTLQLGNDVIGPVPGEYVGQELIWNGNIWVPREFSTTFIGTTVPFPKYDVYVSPSGVDSPKNGSEDSPVKTINYAIQLAAATRDSKDIRIKLANGSYPEGIYFVNYMHAFNMFIDGNLTTPSSVIIGNATTTPTDTVRIDGQCFVCLRGVDIRGQSSPTGTINCVHAVRGVYLSIYDSIIRGSNATYCRHVYSQYSSSILINSGCTVRGAASMSFYATYYADIIVSALTIEGNIAYSNAYANAQYGGMIAFAGTATATGALSTGKRYNADTNGTISRISYIPTSNLVAGTVATGGRAN